jgi:iron(III) transport system ATP-binding protein
MLTIQSLTKTFGAAKSVVAVDDVDLEVAPGELIVLLGPSGCGKTTALRCLAGLESADSGRIRFGDRVVYDSERKVDIPPEKRNIGMVFQSYALWPHKTVRENIAYPLRARRMKRALKSDGWVEEAAALVDCSALLDRYPSQLSGGQQQRVALARSLVARPDVMFFDEPLSNLDALLRAQVRNDLHELHGRVGFSGVYVTHDQEEAFALGDRLAIMRRGRIEQVGPPQEIYERPVSEYAANFVGLRNRLTFARGPDGWRLEGAPPGAVSVPVARESGREVRLRFRPTDVEVVVDTEQSGGVCFDTTVVDAMYCGAYHEVTLSLGEVRISAKARAGFGGWTPGGRARVRVPFDRCSWFDGEGVRIEPSLGANGTSSRAVAVQPCS